MLLNIYLGTTAVSLVVHAVFVKRFHMNLKNKGYKFVEKNESLSVKAAKKAIRFVFCAVLLLLPVYNIVNAITIVCMRKKVYDSAERNMASYGSIVKVNYENNNVENSDSVTCVVNIEMNNNEKLPDKMVITVEPNDTEQSYGEMTVEEKLICLQQEREKLLNQLSDTQDEKPFTLSKKRNFGK